MSRAAVLAGRTLADLVTNSFSIAVMLVVGFIVGFRFETPRLEVVAGIPLPLLFGYAFSWVFALIGLTSRRRPRPPNRLGFIVIFPLTFVSSAFVPVGLDARRAAAVRRANPFTYHRRTRCARSSSATPAGNAIWRAIALVSRHRRRVQRAGRLAVPEHRRKVSQSA